MRPTISWSDLRGQRVGLWGFGTEGMASLARLRELDVRPIVVDRRAEQLDILGDEVLPEDERGIDALAACDVVVLAPGISIYREDARRLATRTQLTGGLSLWLQEADRSRVACITGTKGKSTTTAIAGHLLQGLGYRVLTGGNLGLPPWSPEVGTSFEYWVIETSSYQAATVATAPAVVGVTSLHPDHLPWHDHSVETYYRDKLSLCGRPGARITVANGVDPLV